MILDPHAALASLQTSGAMPRLSWQGNGETLELSGHVLANWTIKIGNLLTELDIDPIVIQLDTPAHWRASVWALAGWLRGGRIVLERGDPREEAEVIVTDSPHQHSAALATGLTVVALPQPSFALRWPGDLPDGVLDGAADIAAQPDRPIWGSGSPSDLEIPETHWAGGVVSEWAAGGSPALAI